VPPAYPYARLHQLQDSAAEWFGAGPGDSGRGGSGGVVDCSIGTPCDPPPVAVVEALATSGVEAGYPTSNGSTAYRAAAAGWMARRFGVTLDPAQVGACVGTKEFVASVAQYLHLRTPDRDVVLYPAVSYPTYAMGARLGGCRAVPVAELDGGGLDWDAIDADDIDRALMLWVNSPSNPRGSLTDLHAAAAWGRSHGVPVFSDECYAEFTWDGPPQSVLQQGIEGVVAVHSLSKRSNLAGVRAGFFAGDPDLVGFLVEVRRHAGLMVPGPVQAAAVVAFDDDTHVEEQRQRYAARLRFLRGVLGEAGFPTPLPAGGFYLWVPDPSPVSGGGWGLASLLALEGGLLTSPGEFYGDAGDGFVRVAVVQPSERLAVVAERLAGRRLSVG
jgi:succinyldiaminopimelate transaminase